MKNNRLISSSCVQRFEHRFNARARPSNMEIRQPVTWRYDPYAIKDVHRTETVPAVEILISERGFDELLGISEFLDSDEYRRILYMDSVMGKNWLNNILNQQDRNQREHHLRSQTPALQKAWEHYQVMLKLVE
jgi:hypothetical protein